MHIASLTVIRRFQTSTGLMCNWSPESIIFGGNLKSRNSTNWLILNTRTVIINYISSIESILIASLVYRRVDWQLGFEDWKCTLQKMSFCVLTLLIAWSDWDCRAYNYANKKKTWWSWRYSFRRVDYH